MKLIPVVAILLFLVLIASGQKYGKPELPSIKVIWGLDENCHPENSAAVKAETPKCSFVDVGDTRFYMLTYKGITYALTSVRNFQIIRATVQVSNNSGSEIKIDPLKSLLVRDKDEKSLLLWSDKIKISGATPANFAMSSNVSRSVKSTTPEKPKTTLSREEVVKPPHAEKPAYVGMRPAENPQNQGPLTLTVLLPNQDDVRNALKAGSLADKEKVAGYVFFRNDEKSSHKVLVMEANGIGFVFPLNEK